MKKNLLLAISFGITVVSFSQNKMFHQADKYVLKNSRQTEATSVKEGYSVPLKSNKKLSHLPGANSAQALTIIGLGQAGNAFGIAFGGRTFLWADPILNAITFSHRSNPTVTGDPSNGFLRYDYSKDGGATWMNDQGPSYISGNSNKPPFANARYPQGLLYNPVGNNIADSAYFTYFAPSLASINGSGTDGGWGGHVHGTVQVSGNLANTQKEDLSTRFLIPDGFTLTKTGVVYNTDNAYDDASMTNPVGYKDTIIISKGIWDASSRDFDYSVSKLVAPVSRDNHNRPNIGSGNRVAFADDGNTGYITFLGHNDQSFSTVETDSVYYLIVYKTTNGGTSWTGPINVTLDNIKPLLPKIPSTKFAAGFEQDAIVDMNGNLHVIMPISPELSQAFSISNQAGTWGLFDIYTTDKGTSWFAKRLAFPETLVGTFGVSATDVANPSISEYNRGQISRSWDGSKLFFVWFDTDTTQFAPTDPSHANEYPSAFVMGYDVVRNKWTDSISTANTVPYAMNMGCASYYVFGTAGTYTVPIAFQEFSSDDVTKTGTNVIFQYVDGLSFVDSDFKNAGNEVQLMVPMGINELNALEGVSVSQNYPNPFNGKASFTITLSKPNTLSVEIVNTIGQQVAVIDAKTYATGSHTISLDATHLNTGVYFYTVKGAEGSVTKRMIIQ